MSTHYANYASNKVQVEYIGRKQRNDCIKTIQVTPGREYGQEQGRGWEDLLPNFLFFSPDGAQILYNTLRGICIWEATSGKLIVGPLGGDNESNALAAIYSPDGRYIIVASKNGIIRKWDALTNCPTWERRIDEEKIDWSQVESAVFSPDARSFVFGNSQGTILVVNIETGKQNGESLEGHTGSITCLSFSHDGRYFASGSVDKTIIIWDMNKRAVKTVPLRRHTQAVTAVKFSPSGNNVISGSLDGTIRVWDAFTGEVLREIKCENEVYSVTYSPNGFFILAGGQWWMNMWNAVDVAVPSKVFQIGYESILRVSFAPDSSRFVSVNSPVVVFTPVNEIQIWDASHRVEETKMTFEEQVWIWSFALSPGGKFIASTSKGDSIYLWNVPSSEFVKKLKLNSRVDQATFSPVNEKIVGFGCHDGRVQMWDVTNDESVTIGNHIDRVCSVVFSPSGGTHVASGSYDKTICIWDVESRELAVGPLIGHEDWVRAVAYSPDGTRLVSGSCDKTVRVWNSENGQLLSTFNGNSYDVNSVAYSSDGLRIVSGSDDGIILVWNAQSGEIVCKPTTRHCDWVNSVCFSPDGERILTGSGADNAAQMWNILTGKPLLPLPPLSGHTHMITSVSFFPNGSHFATGSSDGTIRIWSLIPIANDTNWELRDDNWIVGENGKLMMWIPTDLHTHLYRPRNIGMLNRSFFIKLHFGTERNSSRNMQI